MQYELYSKAVNLLEKIANSVHDRDPSNANLQFFSVQEVALVQDWLKEFADEIKKPAIEM